MLLLFNSLIGFAGNATGTADVVAKPADDRTRGYRNLMQERLAVFRREDDEMMMMATAAIKMLRNRRLI